MSERIVQQPPTTPTQEHFSNLPSADTERSTFDRSHGIKTTFDAGNIVPIMVDEIIPGDTFNVNTTLFIRMATPLKPIMDNLKADIHYFFCPNRILWDSWEQFMGERKSPADDPNDKSIPQLTVDLSQIENTMADYFGLPLTETAATVSVSDLPFRAYELIFNEWYKDQSLQSGYGSPGQPGVVYTGDDGRTTIPPINIRNKRKDYLTSALPFPQKGDPVFLPLGTSAPVVGTGAPTFDHEDGLLGYLEQTAGAGNNAQWQNDVSTGGGDDSAKWSTTALLTDLTDATAATINDIRTAFQIQKLLERDARGGTRYIEIILNHFNVEIPDFRVQRPEYLGGGTGVININPVASTVATVDAPQANLSATATGVIKGSFNHSFTEHGYLMAFVSVRADLTYQNGIERFWQRQSRYDFFWPVLAHLGEQSIKNQEVYVQSNSEDEETWGFQERHAEYRYKPGRITGKFRSTVTESLDVWHLAQDFPDLPGLNQDFIRENPPIDRVIAVPDEPHFLCDGWINMNCTRPMPVYSVPGLVDHF